MFLRQPSPHFSQLNPVVDAFLMNVAVLRTRTLDGAMLYLQTQEIVFKVSTRMYNPAQMI